MVLLPSVWKNREYIKTDWYGETPKYASFEGRKVKILKNYHDYLTMRYGDYMTPTVWEEKGEYKHRAK
jgi:phosphorylcholine metabolism protein LicD